MQSKLFSSLQVFNKPAMISKSKLKLIRSLSQKKYRELQKLFVVEGEKMILELLEGVHREPPMVEEIIATGQWIDDHIDLLRLAGVNFSDTTEKELRSISSMVHPQPVLALVRIPVPILDPGVLSSEIVLGLEAVRDPGNLGTIIRTADWFGIRHILCTPDSVDLFNPKVVQSTMGSMLRVKVHYTELEPLLRDRSMLGKPVYGTFLVGKNIYETELGENPLILFGNESKGLSRSYNPFITARLSIPSFAGGDPGSESLNLASSVAVVCSEIRRRK
ncbi:MAG: RNA methyltransferase [Bacteroidota bacterium]